MALVDSVNLACPARKRGGTALTGIDKRPTRTAVEVRDPGPRRGGLGSGLADDAVVNHRHHGGTDQAVYAYAREDLDGWEPTVGRPLPNGCFGENLTTRGLDVNAARVGERWRIGDTVVLQVTAPRIPCSTFSGWIDVRGWVRTFTAAGLPGAYLRVVVPGAIRAGDAIEVVHRPDHGVTISLAYRAMLTEPELLPDLLAAGDDLPHSLRSVVAKRT